VTSFDGNTLNELEALEQQAEAGRFLWIPDADPEAAKDHWCLDKRVSGQVISKVWDSPKASSKIQPHYVFEVLTADNRIVSVAANRTALRRQAEDKDLQIGDLMAVKYDGLVDRPDEDGGPYHNYTLTVKKTGLSSAETQAAVKDVVDAIDAETESDPSTWADKVGTAGQSG
jgi:hypothetical protein